MEALGKAQFQLRKETEGTKRRLRISECPRVHWKERGGGGDCGVLVSVGDWSSGDMQGFSPSPGSEVAGTRRRTASWDQGVPSWGALPHSA